MVRFRGGVTGGNWNFGWGSIWVGVLLVWNLGNWNQLFVMPLGYFVWGWVCRGCNFTWGLQWCLGTYFCWVEGLNNFLVFVLDPKTVWVAGNLHFTYMYFSTEYAYDYDDWSSYPIAWDLALLLLELHAKFGICEIWIGWVLRVMVMTTGRWKVLLNFD